MHITRADLKTEAKRRLKGQRKPASLVTLVTFLIPSLISPSGLGPLLFDGPLSAGLSGWFLRLIRGEAPGIGTMFQGFSRFLRNVRLWLLQVVFVLLWSALLVVPGVIAALRYSMVWFVVIDEPDLTAREALARSKSLTRGHLRDLFGVWISFFWWFLLGVATMGLGFLYVVPYVQTTLALIYEGLRSAEAASAGGTPSRT